MYCCALRKQVDDLRPVLEMIQLREVIVADRVELERIQLNPERLKNRGANAFAERKKEEAMMKGIKSLDKVTREVLTLLDVWEEANGEYRYEVCLIVDPGMDYGLYTVCVGCHLPRAHPSAGDAVQ